MLAASLCRIQCGHVSRAFARQLGQSVPSLPNAASRYMLCSHYLANRKPDENRFQADPRLLKWTSERVRMARFFPGPVGKRELQMATRVCHHQGTGKSGA